MTDTGTPIKRTGVKIDFAGALDAVRVRPPVDPTTMKAAVDDAKQAGFNGRADTMTIDRRDAFHAAASQFETVEAFIEHLLNLNFLDEKRRREGR
jgi:hypothetical protein